MGRIAEARQGKANAMLTTRISEAPDEEEEDGEVEEGSVALHKDPDPSDIFESCLTTIFNDVRNQHGEPGKHVIYSSPRWGNIKLGLANIDKAQTSLFSHHLWNAGVEIASMIETGKLNVEGEAVMELGAGTKLLLSL